MKQTYLLSPLAEQDIDEIITYLVKESPKAAYDFVDSLYKTFATLAESPYIGHIREDLTTQPLRFLTFKWHYLVIYNPIQPLEIVRIVSGFRDIVNLI